MLRMRHRMLSTTHLNWLYCKENPVVKLFATGIIDQIGAFFSHGRGLSLSMRLGQRWGSFGELSRKAHFKGRVARRRCDLNRSAMLFDDLTGNVQPQARPFAARFGRETHVENLWLNRRRDSAARIGNADAEKRIGQKRVNADVAAPVHCLNRVLQQVNPEMAQIAGITINLGQRGKGFDHADIPFEAIRQQRQRKPSNSREYRQTQAFPATDRRKI